MTRHGKYCSYSGSQLIRPVSLRHAAKLMDCSPDFIADHIAKGTIDSALLKSPLGNGTQQSIRIPISELDKIVELVPRLDSMVAEALEERT